jgi:hypothetical protein
MKRLVTALLIGANIEVWSTSKSGNEAAFQNGARRLAQVCGCISPDSYSMYGVKGAKEGTLILRDKKGVEHRPVDPCGSGTYQEWVNVMADLRHAPENARLVYAYWGLSPSEVKSGYFITLGDTIEVRRP